jgi:hypothetical protein
MLLSLGVTSTTTCTKQRFRLTEAEFIIQAFRAKYRKKLNTDSIHNAICFKIKYCTYKSPLVVSLHKNTFGAVSSTF